MKITPINNNNLQNHLKFRGKKNQSLPKMNKPAKMALIPALAFAAMVPSLVNAKTGNVKQDEPVVQVQTITKMQICHIICSRSMFYMKKILKWMVKNIQ